MYYGRATGKTDIQFELALLELKRKAIQMTRRKAFVKKNNLQMIIEKLKSELKCK